MISAKTGEFKARLAHYIGLARSGREVIVKDRETPVARLVPYRVEAQARSLTVTPKDPSAPALGKVRVQGVEVPAVDSLSLLLEDRGRR